MPSQNRKVLNATSTLSNGISFKSTMESRVYNKLLDFGITPEYESEKIVLVKGFKPNHGWFEDGKLQNSKVRDLTYTPDFKFKIGDYTVYLEVKGFITDRYPLKRKMFLKYLNTDRQKTIFAEIKTIKGLLRTINQIQTIAKQPENT